MTNIYLFLFFLKILILKSYAFGLFNYIQNA